MSTLRTKDALIALLADNTSGAITPSVLRDVLESTYQDTYESLHTDIIDDWCLSRALHQGLGYDGVAINSSWSITLVGTNSALTPVTGTSRGGVARLGCGTTTTGRCAINVAATYRVNWADGVADSGGEGKGTLYMEAVVALSALSTVGQEYSAWIGLMGTGGNAGAAFVYDRGNVTGLNPTNADKWAIWTTTPGPVVVGKLLDGTNGTINLPVVAPVTYPITGYIRFRVEVDATTARFYKREDSDSNWVLCGSIAVAFVHSLGAEVSVLKSAGTTDVGMDLDYTRVHFDYLTARRP